MIIENSTVNQTLSTRIRQNRVRAALDSLDSYTRETFLAIRSGHTYTEVEEHMNISQRAIKRRVTRALLAIMEHGEL
jgi:DNA-directed RNA polymerase specialized sigma24 family protein